MASFISAIVFIGLICGLHALTLTPYGLMALPFILVSLVGLWTRSCSAY